MGEQRRVSPFKGKQRGQREQNGARQHRSLLWRDTTALLVGLVAASALTLGLQRARAELSFTVLAVEREIDRAGRRLESPREVILIASRPEAPGERWVGRQLQVFRLELVNLNLVESYPVRSLVSRVELSPEQLEEEPEELSLLDSLAEEPTDGSAAEQAAEEELVGADRPGPSAGDAAAARGQAEQAPQMVGEENFEDEDELDEPIAPAGVIEAPDEPPPAPLPPPPLPPPPPPMKRSEIGVLRVKWVSGRVVRAEVVYDGLSDQRARSSYAVMRRDQAGLMGDREAAR